MYELTARMLQNFENSLIDYHKLFDGGRVQGWELEELLVKAIKSDTNAQHHVLWKEGGHDVDADLRVRTNGDDYPIQVKSGSVNKKGMLSISGHRLGRFEGDLKQISDFLRSRDTDIISVSYSKNDDERGRHHDYCLRYIDCSLLNSVTSSKWSEKGKQIVQENKFDIVLSLRPTMSWQIWWEIPLDQLDEGIKFSI